MAPFGGGGATLSLRLPNGDSTVIDVDFGGDGSGWFLVATLFGEDIHSEDDPDTSIVSGVSSVRFADVEPPPGRRVSLPFNVSLTVCRRCVPLA